MPRYTHKYQWARLAATLDRALTEQEFQEVEQSNSKLYKALEDKGWQYHQERGTWYNANPLHPLTKFGQHLFDLYNDPADGANGQPKKQKTTPTDGST